MANILSIGFENYELPGDLEAHIGTFVEHYNHRRYHESLKNLAPADFYFAVCGLGVGLTQSMRVAFVSSVRMNVGLKTGAK